MRCYLNDYNNEIGFNIEICYCHARIVHRLEHRSYKPKRRVRFPL
jgi:hypothetical protein